MEVLGLAEMNVWQKGPGTVEDKYVLMFARFLKVKTSTINSDEGFGEGGGSTDQLFGSNSHHISCLPVDVEFVDGHELPSFSSQHNPRKR